MYNSDKHTFAKYLNPVPILNKNDKKIYIFELKKKI